MNSHVEPPRTVGMRSRLSSSAIACRLPPWARSRLIFATVGAGALRGVPSLTPCARARERLARALGAQAPLPPGHGREGVCNALAGRRREVEPEVEGDQVPALALRALEQPGGLAEAACEAIEPGDDERLRLARAHRFQRASARRPAALPSASPLRLHAHELPAALRAGGRDRRPLRPDACTLARPGVAKHALAPAHASHSTVTIIILYREASRRARRAVLVSS